MILLLLVGLIVLICGKLTLTRSIRLTGKRARWYGLTLLLTAIPFAILVSLVAPLSVLADPVGSRVLNYTAVIGYMVLLALPFRHKPAIASEVPRTEATTDTV